MKIKAMCAKVPTVIKTGAFSGCTNLSGVIIKGSVKSIAKWAFSKCPRLASVSVPEGLEAIGESAFEKCSSLASVTLPKSLVSIGDKAFSDTALSSVALPKKCKFSKPPFAKSPSFPKGCKISLK